VPLVVRSQRILFAALFRHRGVAMQFLEAQVAGVRDGVGLGMQLAPGFFEQPEVVAAARVVSKAENPTRGSFDDELRL